MLTGTQK